MEDQLTAEIIAMFKAKAKAATGDADLAVLADAEMTSDTELNALGIDSLTLADMLWDIEQAYNIKIELNTVDAWASIQKIGDLVEVVRGLRAKAN
ncbi:acyl carrier protein [Allorhizobium undicola]|uniref:acyl carrier protein n=1 Tax=Allorhizobium undicola TaxID=78527 RepID=UPI00048263E2|nr:acyl carrier protein [Allorhizobium undicola]